MTEPARLIDETQSEFERALLRAGAEYPSDGMRQARVLAAIGVGATIAVTSKTSVAAALTWKKAVAGVAIAAAGIGGVVTYRAVSPHLGMPVESSVSAGSRNAGSPNAGSRNAGSPNAGSLGDSVARRPETRRAEHSAEELSPPPVEPEFSAPEQAAELAPAEPAAAPPRLVRTRRVAKPQVATPPSASDLQEEVAFLDQARAALRAGRPSSTLAQLGEYRAKFPQGSLRQEAELLRIEALSASGRKTEASKRASRLLNRSPNSVLAARLRRFVQD